jgi:hypothetical protein
MTKKFPITFGQWAVKNIVNHACDFRILAWNNVTKTNLHRAWAGPGSGSGRARARAGLGLGPGSGSGRGALKSERAGWATTLAGPHWAGPGHKNEARFEPWKIAP